MPLYVSEKQSEFVLTADVPGAKREDLSIECAEDGWLSIRGRSGNVEYASGVFLSNVDATKANAVVRDGVLTVRLPKLRTNMKINCI